MFGLPDQRMEQMLQDLQTAIDFQPPHLSHYQLTIEPNTLFASKPPSLPQDDDLWDMTQQAHKLLSANQYAQYEVSAFSKVGSNSKASSNKAQCQHNLNYWQFGDYLGIGAGAHQKISYANAQSVERCYKQKHPKTYMQQVKAKTHVFDKKILSPNDITFEFMLNALRLTHGFTTQTFTEHTGIGIGTIQPILDTALEKKWLIQLNGFIKPTALGNQYLNDVMSLFLTD